jgi:mannosyltransferase OCH1-like enzyme
LGQIVNEARLRPEETRLLANAAQLSNDSLAIAAAQLLRLESPSVAPALALLITTASSGRPGETAATVRSKRLIPRQFHQYWDANVPADVERLMKQACDMNPGYAYRCWNDKSARRYLAALGMPDALRAYCEAKHAAIRADIFRLAVLLAEGGVYLDADDRCTQSLETLMPAEAEAVFYQEQTGSIGNNFLSAVPRHPLIETALDQAVQAVLEGAGESTWLSTGPGLMSRVVAAAIARNPALRASPLLRIVPLWAFRATVQPCRAVAYKRSVRHWQRAGLQ